MLFHMRAPDFLFRVYPPTVKDLLGGSHNSRLSSNVKDTIHDITGEADVKQMNYTIAVLK